MPIVTASQKIERQKPLIVIFGEPSSGKTSISFTSLSCLLFDFDKGVTRAIDRKDTFVPSSFAEILQTQKEWMNGYNTFIIDTGKSLLDDFIKEFVIERDYNLSSQKNQLRRFGVILEEFTNFMKMLRSRGTVIILCHVKTDEDSNRKMPDITGSSYQYIMRQADQVGYIEFKNNKRFLDWNPTDTRVGKNTANLAAEALPQPNEERFQNYMQFIIDSIEEKLNSQTEAQREAKLQQDALYVRIQQSTPIDWLGIYNEATQLQKVISIPVTQALESYMIDFITKCDDLQLFNSLIDVLNQFPEKNSIRINNKKKMADYAKSKNWTLDSNTKLFVAPVPENKDQPENPQQ